MIAVVQRLFSARISRTDPKHSGLPQANLSTPLLSRGPVAGPLG